MKSTHITVWTWIFVHLQLIELNKNPNSNNFGVKCSKSFGEKFGWTKIVMTCIYVTWLPVSNPLLGQNVLYQITSWLSVTWLDWPIGAVLLVTSYLKEFLLRDQKAIAFAERVHQRHLVSDLDSDYWTGTCPCLEKITSPHISQIIWYFEFQSTKSPFFILVIDKQINFALSAKNSNFSRQFAWIHGHLTLLMDLNWQL